MKGFNLITLLLVLFVGTTLTAQQGDVPFNDLPPNPGEGKCYAKCKIPEKYETVSIQKLKKAGTTKVVTDKPVYETATERVMIKEASFKYVYVPATYETVTQQVLVKEGYCVEKVVPARYEYRQTGRELVEPEGGKWVRKKKDPNCFSANPDDCYIMCWEVTPAKYSTSSERVMVQPESTESKSFPAEYTTVKVQKIKTPARYDKVEIPAVYKTITKKVLKNPGCIQERTVTTPDQYYTVNEKRMVSPGYYTGWVEILCADQTTDSKVKEVQKALTAKGYNVGAVDGIMGVKTRAMLVQYQKDNNLPQGNLNLETLRALGINTDAN